MPLQKGSKVSWGGIADVVGSDSIGVVTTGGTVQVYRKTKNVYLDVLFSSNNAIGTWAAPASLSPSNATSELVTTAKNFTGATKQAISWQMRLTDKYNASSIRVRVYWVSGVVSAAPTFKIAALARSNDENFSVALTDNSLSDSATAFSYRLFITDWLTITPEGGPAASDWLYIRLGRLADTLGEAWVLGLECELTLVV